MKYLISGQVVFDDTTNTLSHVDPKQEVISLTTIPARLLCYLLEQAGNTVTREEVLTAVWELYGLHPSGHSLNQNISLLRKAIMTSGIEDEIIQTIPRVGICIDSERISVINENTIPLNNQDATLPESDHGNNTDVVILAQKNDPFWPGVTLFSMIISLVIFYFPTSFYDKGIFSNITELPLHEIGQVGECRLYTASPGTDYQNKIQLSYSEKLAADKLPCLPDSVYIIYSTGQYLLRNSGHFILTRCFDKTANSEAFTSCASEYNNAN